MMRLSEVHLLPKPRTIADADGVWVVAKAGAVALGRTDARVLWAATGLTDLLAATVGGRWFASAGAAEAAVKVVLDPGSVAHEQGYRIQIKPDGVVLLAADPAGMQYGLLTLTQLVYECGDELPCGVIEDHPDFAVRGLMLDISRDRVPTMETVFDIVDLLASLKINHFELYTEHTFAYTAHREVWAAASPMTGDQILELDAYCRDRGVELTPNQNGFGHMERWVIHPRYSKLAEAYGHGEIVRPNFRHSTFGSTLCPLDPGSEELVAGLYEELLGHFTSRRFNIGGDEPWELGKGRSKDECEKRGQVDVYTDFLLKLIGHARRLGKTPMYWGDIVMHYPEQLDRLPRTDAIALEWGYGHDHDFDGHGAKYAAAGVPFWVCPGTNSWLSIVGRTENGTLNMANAAANGLKHGASGYLNTDWGDAGHHQPPSVSFGQYAVGAAASWCIKANPEPDWEAVGLHVFEDAEGEAGRIIADIGRLHEIAGGDITNDHVSRMLILPELSNAAAATLPVDRLEAAVAQAEELAGELAAADIGREDAEEIVDEMTVALDLFTHGCRMAQRKLHGGGATFRELHSEMTDLIGRYCGAWLARSRPGGLADSIGRLEARRVEYSEAAND